MKTATVTITGKIGPGLTATSLELDGVTSIDFQIANNTIAISQNDKVPTFDLDDIATVTYTISGVTTTITIST